MPAHGAPRAQHQRARGRRLAWLLIAIWIVHLFDLGFTLMAREHQFLVEMNPLAALLVPHGPAAIVLYKVALLLVGTAALWYARRSPLSEPATWVYVSLCVLLAMWWYRVYDGVNREWTSFHIAAQFDPYHDPLLIAAPPEQPQPLDAPAKTSG